MSLRSGFLALAVVGLTACSNSSNPTSPSPSPGPTAAVSIVAGARILTTTAFSPNPLNVSVGTTVTWMNNDTTTHDATADNGAFTTGNVAPGASASVKMQTAGTFAYHCVIHPGMVATVTVQ
jgi:plastocyanin